MSDTYRPYESTSFVDTLKKNPLWLLGILGVLALLAGLGWWGVNSVQKSNSGYSYSGLTTNTDPTYGKTDSNYTVVFLEDYACVHCANVVDTINQTIDTYSNRVKFVYKPIDILNSGSDVIAKAALAAHQQGKFHEYNDMALKKQAELRSDREATMISIAKELSLDMTIFNEDRGFNPVVINKVGYNEKDAKNTVFNGGIAQTADYQNQVSGTEVKSLNTGIQSTPTFVVMKGADVVMWWSGEIDATTFSKRLDLVLAE